jgi:hypothetical protein
LTGKTIPDITWNGHILDSASEFASLFTDSMPTFLHYDVQCLDTQVINSCFYVPKLASPAGPAEPSADEIGLRPEKNISILVNVAGVLRMEDRVKGPLAEFSECFVLVPNLERRKRGEGVRREWLVESQVCRFVVCWEAGEGEGLVAMDVA